MRRRSYGRGSRKRGKRAKRLKKYYVSRGGIRL